MKVEKLAAIAEIISSVAIVATLIYLSVQTQQTNEALIANSRQTTLLADISLINTAVSNPEVSENAQKPIAELSAAEEGQVANVFAGVLRTREFAWLQYRSGILDEPTFSSYMETLIRFIRNNEGYRYYWDFFSQTTNPEFAKYVNSQLE